jgi:hypothetical protein
MFSVRYELTSGALYEIKLYLYFIHTVAFFPRFALNTNRNMPTKCYLLIASYENVGPVEVAIGS